MKLSKQSGMPEYGRIYFDMINMKFPERLEEMSSFLNKNEFSILDVVKINEKLFPRLDQDAERENQLRRSYDKSTIFEILDYKKKYNLNDSQLARHFKLSRATVRKWKRIFY
ncbi:helix-turn-helix domain-containing protein [Chryseobacterium nematophagum]|uniref:Helix-turn-helix domain-containing protein n=1 Tax=Chryseobacterium nematophagum TaxID=2305228 RepID=A0A3M7TED1_9FLAO|nr:helix-turn-helix domain-containing protein [Chryseobacterium nematophagum]RNA61424.1 helix-turn-helix domain-containing protein [Chryseobacterium nematophagum]